jgi:hypothetical protein
MQEGLKAFWSRRINEDLERPVRSTRKLPLYRRENFSEKVSGEEEGKKRRQAARSSHLGSLIMLFFLLLFFVFALIARRSNIYHRL